MPELPEVERARKLIAETCTGYVIDDVETVEDKIVYDGVDHLDFAKELKGRTLTGCERKGKQFWLTLSGEGRYPVMHFGMTGMIQLRGQEPTWYRRKIHLGETTDSWPPKFCKFILKLKPPSEDQEERELAFIDPRRLGRLRLVPDPVLSHPPLSELGFDPVLSHPTFDEFKALIGNKKGTIKGLIMDQAFSAGVGNWVADEVLYQARIHPMCPIPALEEAELVELHRLLRDVPLKAVEVNADSSQFPDDWLFRWRWDKGKKKAKGKKGKQLTITESLTQVVDGESQETVVETQTTVVESVDVPEVKPKLEYLALPDGGKATISFITVGGRTSAIVNELQKMPTGVGAKPKAKRGAKKRKGDSDGELSGLDEDVKPTFKRAARAAKKAPIVEDSDLSELEEDVKPTPKGRAARGSRAKKAPVVDDEMSDLSEDEIISKPTPRSQRAARG